MLYGREAESLSQWDALAEFEGGEGEEPGEPGGEWVEPGGGKVGDGREAADESDDDGGAEEEVAAFHPESVGGEPAGEGGSEAEGGAEEGGEGESGEAETGDGAGGGVEGHEEAAGGDEDENDRDLEASESAVPGGEMGGARRGRPGRGPERGRGGRRGCGC